MSPLEVSPPDRYNRELVEQVHPPGWQNPPGGHYNLVAIGGGTAGIVSALIASGLGGKSALIERHLLGGDCLNYGCVPSKALIRASRAAYELRRLEQFGGRSGAADELSFERVMQRVRRLRARISHHDSAQRFQSLGADVYLGDARFTGSNSVEVGERTLTFARCIVATGGRPAVPSATGLRELGYLTSETVFSLESLPSRLIVIGGGPIGCELAQAFSRLGSQVHLVHRSDRLLNRDDPEASSRIRDQFEAEGIQLHLGMNAVQAWRDADGSKRLKLAGAEEASGQEVAADEVLVAIGRQPNVEGLNLEAAGVRLTEKGIEVDDRLRTSNRRIYAAGDVAGSYQFTHAADAMARLCVQNAFFFGRGKLSRLLVPHCTYTDPEVAHIGLTPGKAEQQGIPIDSYRKEMAEVDRAILDGDERGFAVIHCRRGSDRIVGATIVAAHAGEMIGELAVLMKQKIGLKALGNVIHCYPTQVEVWKHLGDQYNKRRLTPTVARLLKLILTSRR